MSSASVPTQSMTTSNVGQTIATTTAPVVTTTVVIGDETIEYIPAGNLIEKDAEAFIRRRNVLPFNWIREQTCMTRQREQDSR
jgi:hypothetical protein